MGFAVFKIDPNSRDVRSFLGRVMRQGKVKPKYLICDKGKQFWCKGSRTGAMERDSSHHGMVRWDNTGASPWLKDSS